MYWLMPGHVLIRGSEAQLHTQAHNVLEMCCEGGTTYMQLE
jgi:hypothetical protein